MSDYQIEAQRKVGITVKKRQEFEFVVFINHGLMCGSHSIKIKMLFIVAVSVVVFRGAIFFITFIWIDR